ALFGVLVVLAAVWTRRISGSSTAGAVVAGIVAISTPMVAMSSWALSEPVGIVTAVACLMLLTEVLRTAGAGRDGAGWPATGLAAAAGLAAALSCLTRYASVVLFPVAAIVLAARPGRRSGRVRLAAIFGVAGAAPFGAWLVRNVAVAGNVTGTRGGTSALSVAASMKGTLAAVGSWVIPGSSLPDLKAGVGTLLCLGVAVPLVVGAVVERRRGAPPAPGGGPADGPAVGPAGLALPAAVFVVLGVLSVAGFEATMAIDPPPRFLLPMFVPLLVGAAVLVALLSRRRSWRPPVTAGLVLVVAAASLPRLGAYIERADRRGLLDYSTPRWRTSPLLAYLRTHPVPGKVFSDDPYVLNLRLGVLAFQTPART